MSKQSQLVKNTLIIAVGKLSTQFLTFLLLPIYTAFLSPAEYGVLDLVMVYMGVLSPVLTMQMEMAVFRHLIDARGKSNLIAKTVASSALLTLAGICVGTIAIGLVSLILSPELAVYIVGVFMSLSITNYLLQVARGLGRNDTFAIASIIIGLINIILSVIAVVVLHLSIPGILASLIIANVIGAIYLLVRTNTCRYLRFSNVEKGTVKSLLGYSWPLVPNHISLWGINGVSRTIVASLLGFVAMGIFAAASKFTIIYTSLYSVFAMSWTESVSLHIKKKDDFLSNTSNSMVKLFASLALGIISVSAILFPLLVASDFKDARYYIPILIAGGFFASLVTHYAAIYLATKQTHKLAIVTFQALLISTALTLAGIWVIGLYAPAIAVVVTYAYLTIRRHYDVQRYVTIRYRKNIIWGLVGFTALVLGLFYVNTLLTDILSVIITSVLAFMINRNEISKITLLVLRRGK